MLVLLLLAGTWRDEEVQIVELRPDQGHETSLLPRFSNSTSDNKRTKESHCTTLQSRFRDQEERISDFMHNISLSANALPTTLPIDGATIARL